MKVESSINYISTVDILKDNIDQQFFKENDL